MSNCRGTNAISTKIDGVMREFIEEEAEKRGITVSEMQRRIFDVYRESTEGNLSCPSCGVAADLGEAV